ncbi:hypothetical protein ABVY18_004173 [Vibrio parahaemolyticus]|nr:hypothetical protein [Vibrio parahaemolyticus]EGR3062208.1 hypothetical protein [Vibrio parahaemolyticus]EGR3071854.1 hypothetical protein [Vibrio parahaemolyticus]EGR3171328.1 hypothetical protein [Vibrio parahaemolyticus]EJC6906668.1 hypothetical protein [Vibrio parahaemolyticus]
MKKTFVAKSLSGFFKPQKNHDLLYTGDVQQFFKTRHSSHICFADDPDPSNEPTPSDEGTPPEADSILGGEGEDDNPDGGGGEPNEDDPDPEGDKDPGKKEKDENENKETGAPEKYELSVPEGMELDEQALEKFEPLFREANMTNEQASKFAAAYGEHVNGMVERAQTETVQSLQDQWIQQNKTWQDALLKDKEFGGANAQENFNVAKSVIDRFGGEKEEIKEIRKAFKETGAGNHPEIMRLLFRVGKAMQDDKIHDNGQENGGKQKADLYPNSPNMTD